MRNTALLYFLATITTSVLAQHNHHYNDIDRSNDQHFVRAALPIALGAAITGSALYTININNNSTGYLYKAEMLSVDVEQLKKMKENILTEAEFENKKRKLLKLL